VTVHSKHLMVRLHNSEEDAARKFNRTENVRPIPPGDPDFKGIYSKSLELPGNHAEG
jgi:hypothetical protein